jgi:hypothetical protein
MPTIDLPESKSADRRFSGEVEYHGAAPTIAGVDKGSPPSVAILA